MRIYPIGPAAAALLVLACSPEKDPEPGPGKLELALSCEGDYLVKTRANDNVRDFRIELVRKDGWSQVYDHFSEVPAILELGGGVYTVKASSPESKEAAFDQPVYEGSAQVTVKVGELSAASLVCTLTNMKVSFIPTGNFTKELSDYTVSVTNAASWTASDAASRTLVWDKTKVEAGQAGYFSVAPLMVKVDAYRASDNAEIHQQMRIDAVAARDHHVVTLDARVTGKLGGLAITIDDSVNEKKVDITIPGWEEKPVGGEGGEGGGGGGDTPPATAPVMAWAANPAFAPVPIEDGMDANIVVKAPESIRTFVVLVDSEVLAPVIAALKDDKTYKYASDGPFKMDLIGDGAMIAALDGMGIGIPTGKSLEGKTRVDFPLSNLIPMIKLYSPAPGSRHLFTLEVSDAKGQSLRKTLTFYMP